VRAGRRALAVLGEPTKSNHPVDVGQRSEAAVLAAFVKHGYRVLTPFGVNHRYDWGRHWLASDRGNRERAISADTLG
jgi:hypothetical protein